MKIFMVITLLVVALSCMSGSVSGQSDFFEVGVYGDDERGVTCVVGEPGETFHQMVWAWVPDDLGLAYITLRFHFPTNLDLSRRPVFNDLVSDVIFSDYVAGTVEWNMIFTGCPSGWVKVFSQECVLLDSQPGRIEIQAAHSMARDCQFVLNDVTILNELTVNDPACAMVSTPTTPWSVVKMMYR